MTQEKQTSIRILQSKPQKKALGKSSIFLVGLLVGIITTSVFFLIFINLNKTTDAENIETVQQNHVTDEVENHTSTQNQEHHQNDDGIAYKQHINEKDLTTAFQHPKKVEQPKPQSSSPFGNIFSHETKPAPQVKAPLSTVLKPDAKATITKPVASKADTKVNKPESKPNNVETAKKEDTKEITPDATVQISIKPRETESTP